MNAREALKKAIKSAEEDYQKQKDDSYFSTFYVRKKQRLEKILSQMENCANMDLFLRELRREWMRFMDLRKAEADHPTFDWYGEHYWEIVYDGEAAGCEAAVKIFEAALDQNDTVKTKTDQNGEVF